MSKIKEFNGSDTSLIRHQATEAAYALQEYNRSICVIAICLTSLYRDQELPDEITSSLPAPEIFESALQIARRKWPLGHFEFLEGATPELLWPAYLMDAIVSSPNSESTQLTASEDFIIGDNPEHSLFEPENFDFTAAECNVQVDAICLCRAHLDPFINKAVQVFADALEIGKPFNIGIMEMVYGSVAETNLNDLNGDPRDWFVREYEMIKDIDGFEDADDPENDETKNFVFH